MVRLLLVTDSGFLDKDTQRNLANKQAPGLRTKHPAVHPP